MANGMPYSGHCAAFIPANTVNCASSCASQKGGSFDALFRPLQSSVPPGLGYTSMMEHKGVTAYPTSDPVGFAATRTVPTSYLVNPAMATWYRTPATDIYK